MAIQKNMLRAKMAATIASGLAERVWKHDGPNGVEGAKLCAALCVDLADRIIAEVERTKK